MPEFRVVDGEVVELSADEIAALEADRAARAAVDPLASSLIDGATFLARVTDAEYAAIISAAGSNVQIARWIELLRLRGEIDVAGSTAQAAKAGLVAAGLLTQARADVIFAPP